MSEMEMTLVPNVQAWEVARENPRIVTHTCELIIWVAETRWSGIQGHIWLHSRLETSLGSMIPCLKNKKKIHRTKWKKNMLTKGRKGMGDELWHSPILLIRWEGSRLGSIFGWYAGLHVEGWWSPRAGAQYTERHTTTHRATSYQRMAIPKCQ